MTSGDQELEVTYSTFARELERRLNQWEAAFETTNPAQAKAEHLAVLEKRTALQRQLMNTDAMHAQAQRNTEFYCALLDQIATHLGPKAFTADDGSVHDTPVRAKLPELVNELVIKDRETP